MPTYLYMNQWNPKLLRPMGEESYLEEAEARSRYETGGDAFEVIPEPDAVSGVPAWSMRVYTGDGSFTVQHYNAAGSISRITGFRLYDGRLFHDEVIDYFYPDQERRYKQFHATAHVTAYIKPDGTSKVISTNVEPGKETLEEYRGVPIDSYWAERPVFGEWEKLADPNYGDAAPQESGSQEARDPAVEMFSRLRYFREQGSPSDQLKVGDLPDGAAVVVVHQVRGGGSLFVAPDGSAMFAASVVSPDKALRAFLDGKRTDPSHLAA